MAKFELARAPGVKSGLWILIPALTVKDTGVVYRFSVLPYGNALPLVHFIRESSPEAEISYYVPRYSAGALIDGRVDAALVPVVDFFACPALRMVPGLGIAADGDVTSVLLRCRRPLRRVATIGLDPESKTSNVLAQILGREHFRLSYRVKYMVDVAATDANVCIGDRALCAEPSLETYDLAGEWKRMTGLPFVFAVWAVRQSCSHVEDISRILQTAKHRGCQSRRQLAGLCSRRLGLAEDRCFDYLANRLYYDLGPRQLEGMNLFRELAVDFLTPAGSREIREVAGHAERQDTITLERS